MDRSLPNSDVLNWVSAPPDCVLLQYQIFEIVDLDAPFPILLVKLGRLTSIVARLAGSLPEFQYLILDTSPRDDVSMHYQKSGGDGTR